MLVYCAYCNKVREEIDCIREEDGYICYACLLTFEQEATTLKRWL